MQKALLLAMSAGLLAMTMSGCASEVVSTDSLPSTRPSKYTDTANAYPEFSTPEAAASEVDFAPRLPKKGGKPKKVVVRDVERGKSLSKSERPMDVHYDGFWIAEAPFKNPAEAAAQLDMVMGREEAPLYLQEVTVSGMRGLAHDPVDLPLTTNADGSESGGLKVAGSSVLWADGKMLYNITSTTLDSEQLLEIAASMY